METEAARQVLADEFRKNDRGLVNSLGQITGSVETYVLKVLPQDLLVTLRAVALDELRQQETQQNPASQILVDGVSAGRRSIDRAMRRVLMRFQDVGMIREAILEAYNILQRITRIQSPAKNSIVARKHFELWIGNTFLGPMPAAVSRMSNLDMGRDDVLRIVGPLVPYGRKLFWNPVGTSAKMSFYRVKSKKSGIRFLPMRGADKFSPRFKPYANRTLRKKANATSSPAQALASMLAGTTPPGRTENAGQIVKRLMRLNPQFRGLHFTDGWVEYAPAIGWSKLSNPRVPAFGVMLSKKGKTPGGGLF